MDRKINNILDDVLAIFPTDTYNEILLNADYEKLHRGHCLINFSGDANRMTVDLDAAGKYLITRADTVRIKSEGIEGSITANIVSLQSQCNAKIEAKRNLFLKYKELDLKNVTAHCMETRGTSYLTNAKCSLIKVCNSCELVDCDIGVVTVADDCQTNDIVVDVTKSKVRDVEFLSVATVLGLENKRISYNGYTVSDMAKIMESHKLLTITTTQFMKNRFMSHIENSYKDYPFLIENIDSIRIFI